MTANFGCSGRRTMASQPSVHNEDRNLLRLRAWEQRNQEASQAKELNLENVPLFGEPYKTNKGDELSNRIQRMLGSYEDGNPCTLTTEPLPSPGYVTISQTGQGLQCTDKSTKASFHNHCTSAINQKCPSSSNDSSQHTMTSSASSPNQHGHSSTLPKISMNHSQASPPGNSAHQQNKSEALLDVRELVSLPQEMSAKSPDNKPQPFPHSINQNNNEAKDTSDRHHLETSGHLSESASAMDVSTENAKPSQKEASLDQATKTNALPSQTFPPLLSSKQPSMVMTQKPTAYVRPMDGQDQLVSDSPELKPSPEPYVPLPELISKVDMGKKEILPQLLETRTNEAQCVEDILTEMTHSWPPLLTTIQTPNIVDPSKSLFSAKVINVHYQEAEHVSSCPGQSPSQLKLQTSLSPLETAHCSGVESASSSDSECSSRSESDSETTAGEQPKPPKGSSFTTEPDAPAVIRGDWQLGNWIRPSQQSTSSESQGSTHVSESPARKRLLLTQTSKHSSTKVDDHTRETKPQLPTHRKVLSDSLAKPCQRRENCEDNHYQQSSQKCPSSDPGKPSNKTHSSKPANEGCPGHSEAAFSVKCEEVVITKDKDMCFTERPKVKTKTRHCKKSKGCEFSDSKQDNKRTSKHIVLDKRKAETQPDIKLVLHSHCPSCSVRYPNPCSCPTQSHVPSDHLSHDQPVTISCSKPRAEATNQKAIKKPHKTTHKHSTKGSQRLCRHPTSLLVKFDLGLLSRVPRTSSNQLEIPSTTKQSAFVIEPDAGGSDATTTHKHGKKSIAPNDEVENKTLPSKKRRLENKNTSSAPVSIKLECPCNPPNKRERKKAKKTTVSIRSKDTAKDLMFHKHCSAEIHNSSKEAVKSMDSCKHKQSSGKHTQQPHSKKQKPTTSCLTVPSSSQSSKGDSINRPLLKFEDRQYPVKHYIKEAKRLKHKADAESDKLSKAYNYLDAAMYFVESGIAMEKDPQISMSSYTMFAETVELLKFVLKLKNSVDPSVLPLERDFIALCLKCQSLLQMAMFHHKHKTALKYSKILTDHFTNSAQGAQDAAVCTAKAADTPSPMPDMPSPANTSTSSGLGLNHSGGGLAAGPVSGTVGVPQAIEQMTFTYVNITTLFLSAHDMWEQAEVLAHRGSGMLTMLDTVMSPLSLTSTMNSMVRYTRQGVHWLRLDSRRVK